MLIKKVTEFILFSSIFIASCAVSLCVATNTLLHIPLNELNFYFFVFGATMAQYNLHYILKGSEAGDAQRIRWSVKNKAVHIILFFIASLLVITTLFSFGFRQFSSIAIMGAIAFLYSYPAIPFVKRKRIKDYGLLKIITLALLWTLVTVWFPASDAAVRKHLYFFVFLSRFLFIFILCLLFDIRDIARDRYENIQTLPVIAGKQKSYLIAHIGLAVFFLLSALHFIFSGEAGVFAAMVISVIATFFVIRLTLRRGTDFVYLAGIDGMMLLQGTLVYLFGLKL